MADKFPPYSFVPGHWPHPTRDPEGHSHGEEPEVAEALVFEQWWQCKGYLRGVELFNAGYYWEAHEAWEEIWKAVGREGVVGELLQGLIKLAAVGVKIRQGYGGAALSLLRQSAAHLRNVDAQRPEPSVAGLDLVELVTRCQRLTHEVKKLQGDPTLPVEVVLDPLSLAHSEAP
jgi:predicted metal-dependent hydrolase